MQSIFKDHNCEVIIQFNSHRKYTELRAYLSLQWGQNWVFLASKIGKLHFAKWAFDNSLLFSIHRIQNTITYSFMFETEMPSIQLCKAQKMQITCIDKARRKLLFYLYLEHRANK